ncbi:MAG: DEAD/DEAH box helicase family protein, partial [Pseudomonadota bacterium]|nr:DEAD/DEAH box helicase family protein [Pseudomonadota bacterium]
MRTLSEIDRLLAAAQKELAQLDRKRAEVLEEIEILRQEREVLGQTISEPFHPYVDAPVSNQSAENEKIPLFRRLFKGRQDVYPKRFESARTGKRGYQPACRNEWVRGICEKPREKGNSLFLDDDFIPYPDQWKFLSSVRPMNRSEVETLVDMAVGRGRVVGVRMAVTDQDDDEPWTAPPSRRSKLYPIAGPLPEKITLIVGNQIYVSKEELTPSLKNRLVRLASFQNPEFYKAQAMRLSTFGKPRIISCCEDFPNHIGIPRGCLDEVADLLHSLGITTEIVDKRLFGTLVDLEFHGTLRPEQELAAKKMLKHDTGVLSATTAFGKTVIAAYLIAARKTNTLVLVHRRQLLDQWVARLSNFLGLHPKEIGQIGAGKRRPSGKVDVALIQSLSRKGVVDDIVGEYGHLVVDECHHISARSFEIVARQCKANYVTGLSATVTRKDGHHPIIFMQCGPVRYRVSE